MTNATPDKYEEDRRKRRLVQEVQQVVAESIWNNDVRTIHIQDGTAVVTKTAKKAAPKKAPTPLKANTQGEVAEEPDNGDLPTKES